MNQGKKVKLIYCMRFKYLAISLAAATAITASAQEPLISGYFRIQNGNGNYLAVTGPFTANANLTLENAERQAGSIFRISAYQDGASYRLTNLGAQGIDLATEKFDPSATENGLLDLLMADYEGVQYAGNMLYGMVQQGYRYGYTSVARATLATVFSFVAGRLEDHASGVEGYKRDEFINVTNRFSKEVLEDLDLGLRMIPAADNPNKMTIYTDMPDFGKVADWYTDTTTPDKQARHDSFFRATQAMTKWLGGGLKKTINGKEEEFMMLWPEAVAMIKGWGYDIAAQYPDYVITDLGNQEDNAKYNVSASNPAILFTFDQVFSDKDYLFNWIKFMMYTILNPETDIYNSLDKVKNFLGDNDLRALMLQHNITRFIYQQLPYFQADSRIYFIAGNVVNGAYNTENYHLGFALDDSNLSVAAEKGAWILEPVTADTRFTVTLGNRLDGMYYGAYVFDFPVTATNAQLFSLSEEKTEEDLSGAAHTYVEFVDETAFDELIPFVIGGSEATATLSINAESFILPLASENMKFEISDDVVSKQHAPARPNKAVASTNGQLRGTLLPVSSDNLQQYWGTDKQPVVYNFGPQTAAVGTDEKGATWAQTSQHNGFNQSTSSTTKANEAVYVPSENKTMNRVLISQPEFKLDTPTAIREIEVTAADEELYTLQGVRVYTPVSGNIYLSRKGNTVSKVLVK